MKKQLKPTGAKLIAKFDKQLKDLISKDLLLVRSAKNQLLNTISYN